LPAWQDECTGNGTSSGHAALCVFAPAAHQQAPGAAVKPALPWESHIASARPALISTRAFYVAVLEGGASNKGPPMRTQFNERGLAAGPVSAAVVDVAAVPPLESSTSPRSTKHKPSLASPASGARTEKKKAGGCLRMAATYLREGGAAAASVCRPGVCRTCFVPSPGSAFGMPIHHTPSHQPMSIIWNHIEPMGNPSTRNGNSHALLSPPSRACDCPTALPAGSSINWVTVIWMP